MLEVDELHVSYGRTAALRGVSLKVGRGEIVCVIGPNGAGKSTLLNTISGLKRPTGGQIRFDGKQVTGWKPEDIAGLGLTMVPEGRHIFQTLTVRENLAVAAPARRSERDNVLASVIELFPIIAARLDTPAGNLSGGEQQQLAIARALVMRPRLIMVDEPSLGLAPLVNETVYDCFQGLRTNGVTLLIVEQSTARVMRVADKVYILNNGSIVLSGSTKEIDRGIAFENAYFGTGSAHTSPTE